MVILYKQYNTLYVCGLKHITFMTVFKITQQQNNKNKICLLNNNKQIIDLFR